MKTKVLLGIGLFAISTIASADQFYVDMGVDYNGDGSTSTSSKDEITYIYQSQSIVDAGADGIINAGDSIITEGGYNIGTADGFGDAGNNAVTGFNPTEVFGVNSDNGYGSDWLLTFSFTGLQGVITEFTPGSSLEIAYGAFGHFDLFLTFDGLTYNNFMDIEVTGAQTVSGGTLLTGLIDFTTVDAGFNDIFHTLGGSCLGDDSFEALANCTPEIEISFLADFNTNASTIVINDNLDGTFDLFGNHDGSAVFNVPEPTSLALLGTGLALFGFTSRRRKV